MNLTTLEQSQQLKAWGAPQDTEKVWLWRWADNQIIGEQPKLITLLRRKGERSELNFETASAYDLESLIAWLGDKFSGLLLIDGEYNAFYGRPDTETSQNIWEAYAETPLAAVFSLCHAIYEKGSSHA